MRVSIKNFAVDMDIKSKGVEFDVYSPDGETHYGDLIVTKTGLEWCKGRVRQGNGVKIKWEKFMELAEQQ